MRKAKQILFSVSLLVANLLAGDSAGRKILQRQDPEYPEIAAKMALHGTVKLRAYIAADGSVRRVEYIGGHPLLAESTVKSIKTWKFEAAPKETTELIEVKF